MRLRKGALRLLYVAMFCCVPRVSFAQPPTPASRPPPHTPPARLLLPDFWNHSSTAVVNGQTFLDWFKDSYIFDYQGTSPLVSGF